MNDLNGLDWSSKPATGQKPGQGNYSAFSTLKLTPPTSGRASPLANKPQSPPVKASTPANDSFSSLVAFGGNGTNKNLSLQEQQKRLAESKLQQSAGHKQKLQEQWAVGDDVWNNLGSGASTPAVQNRNGTPLPTQQAAEEEDDLFAAFSDPVASQAKSTEPGVDDDPFGLSEFQAKNNARFPPAQAGTSLPADDDDILGDLGKPVAQRPPPKRGPLRRSPSPDPVPARTADHPQDKAVAELVDMGFPAGKAKRALEATDTGMNVQAAVGLLLNQAHEDARQKSRGRKPAQSQDSLDEPPSMRRPRPKPSEFEHAQGQNHQRDRSSTPSVDPAKAAQELGATFMKSAGAFWKTAQKQVQQAVSEFNSDNEASSNQPKWMQAGAPQRPEQEEQNARRARQRQQQSSATDEAMMLETERPTPPPRQAPKARAEHMFDSGAETSRDHSPALPSRLRESHSPQPAFMRQQQQDPLASMMRPKPQQPPTSSRSVLNKQAAEDQASQAYVSSARRRKPATPAPKLAQEEGELLEASTASKSLPLRPTTRSAPPPAQVRPPKPSAPIATRPPPPSRSIPSLSPTALKASQEARLKGNDHFKRGDYSSAHESYTSSLGHISASHPLQLVLLTNRSLTALKTGQPKVAIVDADAALTLIGPSKGDGQTVDMQDGTQPKSMREYYGKALMRKAEALETLEKWADAAAVWRQCVEDGHGGATAIQGRARAERAAAPKPPVVIKKAPSRTATRSAPPVGHKPVAAVTALRAQNQAADKLDDEKFALADVVSARINGWRGGREGNLRALLASLDAVLWDGAGWKKIGMADLVLPGKVKINYMKGIGKCHPDKVSLMCLLPKGCSC